MGGVRCLVEENLGSHCIRINLGICPLGSIEACRNEVCGLSLVARLGFIVKALYYEPRSLPPIRLHFWDVYLWEALCGIGRECVCEVREGNMKRASSKAYKICFWSRDCCVGSPEYVLLGSGVVDSSLKIGEERISSPT